MGIQLGIVGYGGMGGFHHRNASKIEGVQVVGAYDIDPVRVQVAEESGLRGFSSLEDLLACEDINTVLVAVPNDCHMEICIAASNAGKHVNRNWQMVPGLIGISVVCLMAAVLTSLLLSRLAVTRIENLAANIRQLREGQNEIWVQSKSKDEIGYLTDEFITMMQLIQHLIKDVYREQLIRKEYQIQMLRAQINPHFLYNTLSAIRWKTLMNGDEEASEIINQLSVFYRTALNKGREFSNVENEMKNIRAYITIQKELQSHLFQVSYHVDSSLYPCKIPVMILQPIVENAILHGLASSRKQDRSLSLSAFGKGRDMIFEIRDDGAGIEAEQLKQLLNSKTNGYGMKNVQERIHLLYGNEYGLEIHSIRGEGTIVRVLLPKEPLTDVEN